MMRLQLLRAGAWISFAVFLFYCTINLVAEYYSLNGVSTSTLRNEVQQYFSPADFTYIIRPVVFISLLLYAAFILKSSFQHKNAFVYFIEKLSPVITLAVMLQVFWLYAFHYHFGFTAFSILCSLMILLILQLQMLRNYFDRFAISESEAFILSVPVSLFTGWITVATITAFVNQFAADGLYEVWPGAFGWNVIAMCLTVSAFLYFLFYLGNPAAGLPVLWNLYGVSRNFHDTFPHDGEFRSLATVCFIFCLCLFLLYYIRRARIRSLSY